MAAFWAEMGVVYLEINKLPSYMKSMYNTKLGVLGCFILSFLICF
jgi:hypothetical protein